MLGDYRSIALVLLLLALQGPHEARGAGRVELLAPRPFGYLIGDIFTHEVMITLDPGATLETASLPRPGPRTYWLDLVAVDVRDLGASPEARRYQLRLRYQSFYAPLEPKMLATPPLDLAVLAPDGRGSLEVPAWSFLMSPLREIVSTRAGASMALQPDVAPRPHDLALERGLVSASAGLALIVLAALAWLRGWRGFRKRHRPFELAARNIAKCLAAPPKLENYLDALLALHRAFDAAAGRRLLADDLRGFIDSRPGFRSLADEMARFFAASRQAFFGTGTDGATRLLPATELDRLARRLARLERAGA